MSMFMHGRVIDVIDSSLLKFDGDSGTAFRSAVSKLLHQVVFDTGSGHLATQMHEETGANAGCSYGRFTP